MKKKGRKKKALWANKQAILTHKDRGKTNIKNTGKKTVKINVSEEK